MLPACGGNWYVVFCKPHQEERVSINLTVKGFEVYYPTYQVQTDDLHPLQIKPFFPRYLFVRAAIENIGTAAMLNWIPGAIGLVKYGDTPAIVPDHIIDQLKKRISRIAAVGGPQRYMYRTGERVRIIRGPFAGYEAVFDLRLSGVERVRVLIQMLNRQVTVDLNANAIEESHPPH